MARFSDVVADRLFAVNVFAQLHGDHGRQRMVMVGRGDEHRINLFADLVEHRAVVREDLKLVCIQVFSFQPPPHLRVLVRVRIDDGVKVLLVSVDHLVQMRRHPPAAAADLHAVQFVNGPGRGEDVGAGKKAGCRQRACGQGSALEE